MTAAPAVAAPDAVVLNRYVRSFFAKVAKQPNGCWTWTGLRTDAYGYGRVVMRGRRAMLAHRASWMIHRGQIPEGACVLHHCDNPPCVNPDHLFLGDRGDNARDMAAKGRQHVQRNPAARPVCPPDRKSRGAAHYRTHLTDAQVLEIRDRFAHGERKARLGRAFGLSIGAITGIVEGLTWKHVGGPIARGRP